MVVGAGPPPPSSTLPPLKGRETAGNRFDGTVKEEGRKVRLHTLFRHDWTSFASFIALSALVKHAFIGSRNAPPPARRVCLLSAPEDRMDRQLWILVFHGFISSVKEITPSSLSLQSPRRVIIKLVAVELAILEIYISICVSSSSSSLFSYRFEYSLDLSSILLNRKIPIERRRILIPNIYNTYLS